MKTSYLLGLLLILSACGKKATTAADTMNSEDAAIEASLGTVSGMADEQAGEDYARIRSADLPVYARVRNLVLPSAEAQSLCNRAVFATCSGGERRADYSDCSLGYSSQLNGYVALDYSQSSCSLSADGDTVTRSYDLQLSGPRGGTAQISSAVASDYRGISYGGGGRLTKTAGGYDIEVLGKNIALNFRGHALYNVSIRTLATMSLSGGLARSGRVLDGGQLEVNHNLAGFTAVLQPHTLSWSASCCYPSSGSVDIAWSGSKSGSSTLTFNGCGSATLSNGSSVRSVQLQYCE